MSEKLTHQARVDLAGAHRPTATTLLNDALYEGILGQALENRLAINMPADLWVLSGYHPPFERPAE